MKIWNKTNFSKTSLKICEVFIHGRNVVSLLNIHQMLKIKRQYLMEKEQEESLLVNL